jgi:hypothetical protein
MKRNVVVGVIIAVAVVLGSWQLLSHRSKAKIERCLENLKAIDGAKVQASLELGLKAGDTVPNNRLMLYQGWPPQLRSDRACHYTVNPVGTPATCSVREHTRTAKK